MCIFLFLNLRITLFTLWERWIFSASICLLVQWCLRVLIRKVIILIIIIITYLTRVNPSAEGVKNGCPAGQLKMTKRKITITDQLSKKYKNYVQCWWIKTNYYITTEIKTLKNSKIFTRTIKNNIIKVCSKNYYKTAVFSFVNLFFPINWYIITD